MPASRRVFLSRAALSAGALISFQCTACDANENHTGADPLRTIGNVSLIKVWTNDWRPALHQDSGALDLALRAMRTMRNTDAAECLPQCISAPNTREIVWDFGHLLVHLEASPAAGTAFYGTKGTLLIAQEGWKLYRPDGSVEQGKNSSGLSAGSPSRESITLFRLAHLSHQLGREIRYDPKTNSFPGDEAAIALFTLPYSTRYPLLQV